MPWRPTTESLSVPLDHPVACERCFTHRWAGELETAPLSADSKILTHRCTEKTECLSRQPKRG